MSFTEYTRHMYIFPKGVRVRVDLPRFPEFFTRSRRAYRNYQNREKYEREEKAFHVYIFEESTNRCVEDAQRNFDAWQKERIGMRVWKRGSTWRASIVVRQQIWPESEIDLSDRLNRTVDAPSSSVHSEFNFELGNQTSVFQLHPPLVTHSSDNSKSLQGSKLANNRLSIKA